jgi:hypothetical protein
MHVVATTYLGSGPSAVIDFLLDPRQPWCAPRFPPGNEVLCKTRMYGWVAWGGGRASVLTAIRVTRLWFLATGSQQGAGEEGITFVHFSTSISIHPPSSALVPVVTRSEFC